MGTTGTRVELETFNLLGGNCPVIGLGHSLPFSTEVEERVWLYISLSFLCGKLQTSTLNVTFCQSEE